jgi:hypothetical protein
MKIFINWLKGINKMMLEHFIFIASATLIITYFADHNVKTNDGGRR